LGPVRVAVIVSVGASTAPTPWLSNCTITLLTV